jgi:hypothetical protein
VKINPTVTLVSNNADFASAMFSSPSAGTLKYIGTDTAYFLCNYSTSISVSSAADDFRLAIFKNGAQDLTLTATFNVPTANVFQIISFTYVIQLVTNDTLDLRFADISTSNKTAKVMNLKISALSVIPSI